MELTYKEILSVNQILKESGKIEDIIFNREIKELFKITSNEFEKIGININNEIRTDDIRLVENKKNIELSLSQLNYLKKCVEIKINEEKITEFNLDLCLKIRDWKK